MQELHALFDSPTISDVSGPHFDAFLQLTSGDFLALNWTRSLPPQVAQNAMHLIGVVRLSY
jgi:hypothetical protein